MPPAPPPGLGRITARVFDAWAGLHPADGVLPGRRHLDPASLPPAVLPHLWLLDVERAPWRFRYRLVGGALRAAGAPARPGETVDRYDPDGSTQRLLTRVCETGTPAFRRGPPRLLHDRRVRGLEALVLPLAADGRTVDMLLCCTVYVWQDGYGPWDPRPD